MASKLLLKMLIVILALVTMFIMFDVKLIITDNIYTPHFRNTNTSHFRNINTSNFKKNLESCNNMFLELTRRRNETKTPKRSMPGSNISVCTLVRNECHLVYSWVLFHVANGVKKVHIYSVDPQDCTEDILSEFIEKGIVNIHRWPQDGMKKHTSDKNLHYNLCGANAKKRKGRIYLNMQISNASSKKQKCIKREYFDMLDICKEHVKLSKMGLFQIDGTPYQREFCQQTAFADCFIRHRAHNGLLGIFDVDEYMFPADSDHSNSLVDAFNNLTWVDKTHVMVEGLIYGYQGQYRRHAPFELTPDIYQWHAPIKYSMSQGYHKINVPGKKVNARTFALKTFYRLPDVLQLGDGDVFDVGVHQNRHKHEKMVIYMDREKGTIKYNHYMYKSMEENTLSASLSNNQERKVNTDTMNFYSSEYGSRMSSYLNRFKKYWHTCSIPKIQKHLSSRKYRDTYTESFNPSTFFKKANLLDMEKRCDLTKNIFICFFVEKKKKKKKKKTKKKKNKN
jgi:hypothetical protein